MSAVRATRQMAVSPEALRSVIVDFKGYKEFLDEVVCAEILPGSDSLRPTVRFEIEVIKKFHYILEFEASQPLDIAWTLKESSIFKKNNGSWKLERTESGTLATYELDVELGFFVPSWVSRRLTQESLPRVLEKFENRAAQIGGEL